jgi:hypothetical protein
MGASSSLALTPEEVAAIAGETSCEWKRFHCFWFVAALPTIPCQIPRVCSLSEAIAQYRPCSFAADCVWARGSLRLFVLQSPPSKLSSCTSDSASLTARRRELFLARR